MKALELADKIKLGVSPVYLFTGDDAYLRDLALQTLKETVDPQYRDVCCETLDGAELSIDDLIASAQSMSFVAQRRIVEVRGMNRELSAKEIEKLNAYLLDPNDNTVLALTDGAKSFAPCAKYCVKIDCSRAHEDEILDYIGERASRAGYRADVSALRTLIRACGCDLGKIMLEMRKLTLYCADTKVIDADAIAQLTPPDTEMKVFELTNALQRGDAAKALSTFDLLLARGEKAPYLLAVVTGAYRKLFHVAVSGADDATLCKVLNLSPGALAVNKKIVAAGKRATQGYVLKLKSVIDTLYELEYRFKSGEISPESALHLAFGRLIGQSAGR